MKKIIILGAILGSVAVYGETVDLKTVLDEVRNNNVKILSSGKNLEIKELTEKQGIKALLPGVNLKVDKEILNNNVYRDLGETIGPQKIEMPINIYSGGKDINNYRKIKIETEIARSEFSVVQQEQELKAIQYYFDILNLQKQLEITALTRGNLEKQEKRLNILFSNNKMVSKNELLEVRANIMTIDAENLNYRGKIRIAKDNLAQLMGIEGDLNITEYKEVFPKRNLEDDMVQMKTSNSALKKTELEIEKSKLDVKIAKAGYLPTVDLTPSYRLDRDLRGADNDKWALQLKASMNVFQWGATSDEVKSKKLQLERKEIEHSDAIRGKEIEIKNKYREIEQLIQEIEIADQRVAMLEENSKIQNIRFSNGMISSLDYLESAKLQRNAEENRYSLEKSLILANRAYSNLLK